MVLLTYGYSEGENWPICANAPWIHLRTLLRCSIDERRAPKAKSFKTTCSRRSVPGGKSSEVGGVSLPTMLCAGCERACVRPPDAATTRTETDTGCNESVAIPPPEHVAP